MNGKGISLIVPVYNEAEIIEESIDVFTKALRRITENFEIIVVDDGSGDGTREILGKLSDQNEKLKVFYNKKNIGSGASLWRGLKGAAGEYLISDFADRPFDLDELPALIKILSSGNIDFVIGVRKDRSANSFFRKITSFLNYFLVRFLFGVGVSDFQFVQMYKKEVIDKINIISRHTFVAPEIIIKAMSLGYKYKEYRADFYPRTKGRAKYSDLWFILKSVVEIFVFYWHWEILKEKRNLILT